MSNINRIKTNFSYSLKSENSNMNFLYESEIISELIINKLINIVVNKVFVEKIMENYSDHLIKYLKRILTPLIRVSNLIYDKDNFSEIDIKEPKKIFHDSHLPNKLIKNEEKIKEIIKETNPQIKRFPSKRLTKFIESTNSNKENSVKNLIKKRFSNKIFQTYFIKNLKSKEEPKEIETLRIEYQNEIKEKEEKLLEKNNNEIQKIKMMNDLLQKKKLNFSLIDSEKYTFDSNGKIINLNKKKINLINEFQEILPKTKFIKIEEKGDDFYNFKPPPKEKIMIERQSERISTLNEMIKEEKKKMKESTFKIKKITKNKIYPVKETKTAFFSKLPPSGDNFHHFKPEIGVSIKSYFGEKKGSFEFHKLYNRYSSFEFNNILEETINHNKNKVKNDSKMLNEKNSIKYKILEENNNLNKNNDDNSNLSSNSSNSNSKIKSYLNYSLNKNLLSDKNYSFNHIILNKSLLGNSSLLDSVDDYEQYYDSELMNSLRKSGSCKNFEIKKLFNFKRKFFKKNISQEQRSDHLINNFNINLVQNNINVSDLNDIKYKNLPNLKPILPKYRKLIKKNGIVIKSDIPSRMNSKIPLIK